MYGWLLAFSRGWGLYHWQNIFITPRERGLLRFYGYRKASLLFAKSFLISVCGSIMIVSTYRNASLSFNRYINTTLSFGKRSTRQARRTGMTRFYDDCIQCNTILQNSPPQARKFLGFRTVYLNDLVIFTPPKLSKTVKN